MKIKRFTRIKSHRIFKNFSWPENLQPFGQFNLIYGWNGSGKTTLSSIFRHLQTRSIFTEGDIEIDLNGTKFSGDALSTAPLPNVRVFNRDFVASTILAANTQIDAIYYLGEGSVEKQKHVEKLKDDLTGAQTRVQAARSAKTLADKSLDDYYISKAKFIKELLISSRSTKYNNYDKRMFKQALEHFAKSSVGSALLSDQDKAKLKRQKDSQPKETVSNVAADIPSFSEIDAQAAELLKSPIASKALEELATDREVSNWAQHGLSLHSAERKTENCRFCNQQIPKSRIQDLEAHFNETFTAFQSEITKLARQLESYRLLILEATLPEPSRFYDHLAPTLKSATLTSRQLLEEAATYLSSLKHILMRKHGLPFEAISLEESIKGARHPDRATLIQSITTINQIIDQHNATTNDFQGQIDTACGSLEQDYVNDAFTEHLKLTEAVNTAAENLITLTEGITSLELQVATIESEIVEHRRPAQEINAELCSYLGRDELRLDVKETGYTITRCGQPATELSEGEKTAIAFLYFLKSLQDKSLDLTKSIVVIDDPVSSLDTNALFSAFAYMKERTKTAGQLFIMTHNFGFFRQVKNWFHHMPKQRGRDLDLRPARFYMLNTAHLDGGRSASLEVIDPLLVEYESEYHYLFKRIYDEAHRADTSIALQEYYGVPNQARRLTETFLTFRYPGGSSDLSKKLDNVAFDPGKKTRILRFLHTYSHSGTIAEPEHDPSLLLETKPVLCDLLDLIKECDPIHFAGMLSIITPAEHQNEE